MTSDADARPDTSTVRTALAIAEAAEELAGPFHAEQVLTLTDTLLVHGTTLRPSDLGVVYSLLRGVLGLRRVNEETDRRVLEFVQLVLEDGRELRPYQRDDVLEALERRWGVGSDVPDREPEGDDE